MFFFVLHRDAFGYHGHELCLTKHLPRGAISPLRVIHLMRAGCFAKKVWSSCGVEGVWAESCENTAKNVFNDAWA